MIFVYTCELLGMAVAYSTTWKLDEHGPDGNPILAERFTQILLPIMEMADKQGESVDNRVKEVFQVLGFEHSSFFHVCSDGGVEVTGNSREHGEGPKGMFYRSFYPVGCKWTWCLKHLLNIVYSITELTDIYKNLDTISRFLRVANRFNKLKEHMLHGIVRCPLGLNNARFTHRTNIAYFLEPEMQMSLHQTFLFCLLIDVPWWKRVFIWFLSMGFNLYCAFTVLTHVKLSARPYVRKHTKSPEIVFFKRTRVVNPRFLERRVLILKHDDNEDATR